jgi:hypothetical protein
MRLTVSFALFLASVPAWSLCRETVRASTPTARFVINANGTATDRRTGLTWQRCALGSVLDDGGTPAVIGDDRCLPLPGVAQAYSWGGALVATQSLNAAGGLGGFADWRVPNRKELASIVETRCTSPAINSQVFPDTTSGSFFVSTATALAQGSAFTTNFASGGEGVESKTALLPVRVVR